jgi:hypothetical protein
MVLVQPHTDPRLVKEHMIYLLQTSARSFNTKEPRQRHKGRIHNRPHPEVVAANVGKTDRRHHHNDKVAHPVTEYADSSGFVANAKRLDFSAVGPADRENTESEAIHEEEHEGDCDDGVGVGGVDECAGDDGHTCCTANAREDDSPTTTEAIDVEVRRPRENGVLSEGDGGKDQGHTWAVAEIVLEDVCEVVAEGIWRTCKQTLVLSCRLLPRLTDAGPLVHHVWAHAEKDAMQVS